MPVANRKTATSPMWVGWYRAKGSRWMPLVSAMTYDDAWRTLLAEIGEFRSGEWVVLVQGRMP